MTKKLIELTQQAKKLRNSLTKDLKPENIKTSWTKKNNLKKLHVYVSKTILINKLEITDCIQKMEATMMSFLFWALILKIILNTVSQYFKRIPGIIWLTMLPGMSYGMSHLKILLSKRLLASNKSVKNKTNMWVYKVCGSDTSLSLFLKRCCLLYIYMVRFIYGLYIWFRPYKGTTNYSVRVWKTRGFSVVWFKIWGYRSTIAFECDAKSLLLLQFVTCCEWKWALLHKTFGQKCETATALRKHLYTTQQGGNSWHFRSLPGVSFFLFFFFFNKTRPHTGIWPGSQKSQYTLYPAYPSISL